MDCTNTKRTFLSLLLTGIIALATASLHSSDKVLLSDVKALTLYQGQMTNARRSAPVPQLKCVGGSAQYKFTPKVVQCMNRGTDGYDIQWECKTDMDNAYRFGHVEVTCEGYDYPNDPYVLKGSCGLEYTIEFTEEGLQREKNKGNYGYSQKGYTYEYRSEGGVSGIFVFAGILVAIYVIYKTCLAPGATGPQTPHAEPSAPPPPYGFRPEFMPNHDPPPYENCGTQGTTYNQDSGFSGFSGFNSGARRTNTTPNTGGGFWTGAATGGLLGYLFGRGNNYGHNYGHRYGNPGWGGWGTNRQHSYSSGNNSGGSFFSSSPRSSGSSSSGTRTASGFGGTSRR